ncbi:MAG: hypothetical protein GY938_17240 [Ketobacter sp.]|nr:hypothetical protein [Ketobacter sp.]
MLKPLVEKGLVCENPSGFNVREANGQDIDLSMYTFLQWDPQVGVICLNADNKKGCPDLEVRYCCPKECPGYWTQWFDRDNPGGKGDFETLSSHRKMAWICEQPLWAEAETVQGVPAGSTG